MAGVRGVAAMRLTVHQSVGPLVRSVRPLSLAAPVSGRPAGTLIVRAQLVNREICRCRPSTTGTDSCCSRDSRRVGVGGGRRRGMLKPTHIHLSLWRPPRVDARYRLASPSLSGVVCLSPAPHPQTRAIIRRLGDVVAIVTSLTV